MKEKDLQTISATLVDKLRVLTDDGSSKNVDLDDFVSQIEVQSDFQNLKDGSAEGSVRGIGTLAEDESYTLGDFAVAIGGTTKATGTYAFAEGSYSEASGYASHAEGYGTKATQSHAHAEGESTNATNEEAHAEGYATTASAIASHAEGQNTTASGTASHSEGGGTTASGATSHAEGGGTEATAQNAHAECGGTHALGIASHAEGNVSTARGVGAHSEGAQTIAEGAQSHAEGAGTTASGSNSHAEGCSTEASGGCSHAEGGGTVAKGNYSHASGNGTQALSKSQFVCGEYNELDNDTPDARGDYAFIVGNGNPTGSVTRSNAFAIKWDGTFVFADGTEMTPAQFAGIASDFGEAQIRPSFVPSSSDSQYNRICKAGRICRVEAYLQFSSARTIAAGGSYTAGTIPDGFRPMKNFDRAVSSNQNVIARIKPDGDIVLLNNSNTSESVSNFYIEETYITP